jgi:transcription antitermination factor NusA-like protein
MGVGEEWNGKEKLMTKAEQRMTVEEEKLSRAADKRGSNSKFSSRLLKRRRQIVLDNYGVV